MIKLLTDDKYNEFTSFCSKTPLGSVILTKLLAYGSNTSLQYFWYCESNEKITAVFNLDGGLMTISGAPDDIGETYEFIKAVGGQNVYSDHLPNETENDAERSNILIFGQNATTDTADDIDSENIKNIFPVIYEDSSESEKETIFDSWYPDISLKMRRGLIRAKVIKQDGKFVSCAVTCAENNETAVITGVATLREYRQNGYAKQCVLSLAHELTSEGKNVYLITNNDRTKKWYEKMGFKHFSYRYSFVL